MHLPDAERLFSTLADAVRPALGEGVALVGIHTGGAWLAERLQRELSPDTPLGFLDISFYRDDYSQAGLHPKIRRSEIPFDVENRRIILVDDVLYTGRTIRAAMNELFDYGRPAEIRLAVLIDRGGRELPIEAQFVGGRLDVPEGQEVHLGRDDGGRFSLSLHPGRGG